MLHDSGTFSIRMKVSRLLLAAAAAGLAWLALQRNGFRQAVAAAVARYGAQRLEWLRND